MSRVRALVLPLTAVVIVPGLLRYVTGFAPCSPDEFAPLATAARGAALLLILSGGVLMVWTVLLFSRVGGGSLAPWDPPRHLVVEGPYRHVRNPMIVGVGLVLLGQALGSGSAALYLWCGLFVAGNHLHFLVYEEPDLEARFGDEYRRYRTNVPRWIPRRTPWGPERSGSGEA